MYYGLIIADDMEYAPFAEYAKTRPNYAEDVFYGRPSVTFSSDKGSKIRAVYCAIGKVNAGSAASFLIADGADMILNSGLSGAINGDASNRLILVESTFESDFDMTPLGYKEFEKPKQAYIHHADERILRLAKEALPEAVVSSVACGDLFLTDPARGDYLFRTRNAEAFDMESGAVAAVCRQCDVPFLIIRQISDGADENAAVSYRHNNEHALHRHLMADIRFIDRFDEENQIR